MNKKSAKFLVDFTRKNQYALLDKSLEKKLRNPPFWFGNENQFEKITNRVNFKLLKNNKFLSYNTTVLRNSFEFNIDDLKTICFSFQYHANRTTYYFKCVIIELNKEVPNFVLEPEHFFNSFLPDIDFKENPIFSKMYRLKSENENEVRRFFNNEKLKYFEENQIAGSLEINSNELLYLERGSFSNDEDTYNLFISNVKKIVKYFN